MLANYKVIDINEAHWVREVKEHFKITSIDKIALETVYHDLSCSYMKSIDHSGTTLEEDANETYYCSDALYSSNNIHRIYIEDCNEYYIFSHAYVTKNNRIIVVVLDIEDIWNENNLLEEEIASGKTELIHFLVEY
ncbi:hypothetical protein [Clostridium tertium]|uniref:hypothetical protein n=1 Tax=Clostridium tertium TaxID=1559 RepID=UPI0023B2D6F5|nr:hypothetical protein [Clostridium tertium]